MVLIGLNRSKYTRCSRKQLPFSLFLPNLKGPLLCYSPLAPKDILHFERDPCCRKVSTRRHYAKSPVGIASGEKHRLHNQNWSFEMSSSKLKINNRVNGMHGKEQTGLTSFLKIFESKYILVKIVEISYFQTVFPMNVEENNQHKSK